MNFNEYTRDPRYWAVWQKMQLLDIRDVSTDRQDNNGTIVWQLPIKNKWPSRNGIQSYIQVASFSTGYVRNQNSGYSNYQLNKRCEGEPEYFPIWEWKDLGDSNGELTHVKTDKYRKFTTKSCVLIPIEIDRLEYLISYCLKNYFIKRANEVANGKYVHKSLHKWELEKANKFDCGHSDKINELEEKLDAMTEDRDCKSDRIHDLENKLSNAISPTKYEVEKTYSRNLEIELAETKVRQDVSVIVNGHRYKVL